MKRSPPKGWLLLCSRRLGLAFLFVFDIESPDNKGLFKYQKHVFYIGGSMIEKIISGGQTGADIAGLMVAKRYGLKTGGTMPRGWLTTSGPRPEWGDKFGLSEHSSAKYAPRTHKNVQESDATIRLAFNFNSAGERCTLKAIHMCKKPHIDVDLSDPIRHQDVIDFMERYSGVTLNIAGNSEVTYNGTCGEVFEYLSKVMELLGLEERL